MVNRQTFDEVIKDVLNNLYDVAALETHPLLFSVIQPPSGYTGNKGEYVRQLILDAVEQLKPIRKEENINSPEWRPYFILHKRYEEGIDIQQLSDLLAISSRQLRRDNHRALQALTEILWNWCYPSQPVSDQKSSEETEVFETHNVVIDSLETARGVYTMLKHRFDERGVDVVFDVPEEPLPVITDRIVLRQVLISLFNDALHLLYGPSLRMGFRMVDEQVVIDILIQVTKEWEPAGEDEDDDLNAVRYWCDNINARLEETVVVEGRTRFARRTLWLPPSNQKIILIIDDQEPAINMFKRYLSQTDYLVVGVSQSSQALSLARHLQPALITLDVMMPQIDGWELLQTLKLDQKTHAIPVIVCSAWDDPDLSRSLGAAAFLKKPITQKMLLDAVEKISPSAK
jgi:CheY-like chemotaxis protein